MKIHPKLLSSIIGGILFHISLGSVFPLGMLSIYILSYYHESDRSITVNYGFFFMPVITFTLTIFVPLGGFIEAKLGIHVCIIIGSSIAFLGSIALYFSTSLYITYGLLALFGISFGLCIPAPAKNACLYDPKHKGIISSIITAVGHVFNSIFTIVGELMVNSEQKFPEVEGGFYEHNIAIKTKNYFILIICAIPVGTILALLLTYQYNPEYTNNENGYGNDSLIPKDQNNLPQSEETPNNDNLKIDLYNNYPNEAEKETDSANLPPLPSPIEREKMNQQLCKAIKHYRLWFLSIITFLSSFVMLCCLNTFKIVGSLNEIKVSYMTFTATFMGFANIFLTPIWGYCADKVQFRKLFNIMNVLGIFSGVLMSLTLYHQASISFCLVVAVNMICAGGSLTVMHTHIMTVYSVKYVMQLGGVTGLTNGLANLLGSIFAFVITNVFDLEGSQKTKGFFVLYGVGSALSVIAFVMTWFETDEEFWEKEDFGYISAIASGRTSAVTSNDISYIKPEEGDSSIVVQNDEEKYTKGQNEETQKGKEETQEVKEETQEGNGETHEVKEETQEGNGETQEVKEETQE